MVDNGSHDTSVAFVEKNFPVVKILPLDGNTGFAPGNNLGFEAAKGEYLVILNNDTRTNPLWLEVLLKRPIISRSRDER